MVESEDKFRFYKNNLKFIILFILKILNKFNRNKFLKNPTKMFCATYYINIFYKYFILQI